MEVKALVPLEPAFDRLGLVGRIIVDDQMEIEMGRGLGVDQLEKPQELRDGDDAACRPRSPCRRAC